MTRCPGMKQHRANPWHLHRQMPVEGPCVTFPAPPASSKFLCYVQLPCGVWRYELWEIKTPTPAARHVIKWARLNKQTPAEGKISAISIPLHGKRRYNSIQQNVQEFLGAALIFDYDNAEAKVLHAIYLFLPRDINLLHNATVPTQDHLRYWEELNSCVQLLSSEFRQYIKRAQTAAGVWKWLVSERLSPIAAHPWTRGSLKRLSIT